VWEKLAAHYGTNDDVVLAKLDYTVNEHKDITLTGFPTLFFYPKGAGEVEVYSGERDFAALSAFIDERR
jgi:hypothetical protein